MKLFRLGIVVLLFFVCFAERASAQRYQGEFNLAEGIGVGMPNMDGWNIQTIHGYRFNPYLFVGGGIGLIKYFNYTDSILPVFVNVKGYLLGDERLLNPFVSMDVGYGFREGGNIYFTPAMGVQIRKYSWATGFYFSVGWQRAKMYSTTIENINIRIGFFF